MQEEKVNSNEPVNEPRSDYQAPAVEEVISAKELEREVAYAGVVAPSQITN